MYIVRNCGQTCQDVAQFNSVPFIRSVHFLAFSSAYAYLSVSRKCKHGVFWLCQAEDSLRCSSKCYEGIVLSLAEENDATTKTGVYKMHPVLSNRYDRMRTWKQSNLKKRGNENCWKTDGQRWWDNRKGTADIVHHKWHYSRINDSLRWRTELDWTSNSASYCHVIRDANK